MMTSLVLANYGARSYNGVMDQQSIDIGMNDRIQRAYHEAGHVVFSEMTGRKIKVVGIDGVKLNDGTSTLAATQYDENEPSPGDAPPAGWLVDIGRIMSTLAGPIAQSLFCQSDSLDYRQFGDYLNAKTEVAHYSGFQYLNQREESKFVENLVRCAAQECKQLLMDTMTWSKVQAVAEALLKSGTLNRTEVRRAMSEGVRRLCEEQD